MSKIVRNYSTPEARDFWRRAKLATEEVSKWPIWKRQGVYVDREYELKLMKERKHSDRK